MHHPRRWWEPEFVNCLCYKCWIFRLEGKWDSETNDSFHDGGRMAEEEAQLRRKYGSGSIIYRGNRVGIAVSLGKNKDGTRNRPVFYADTLAEAQVLAEAAKLKPPPRKTAPPTVDALFTRLLPLIQQTRRAKTYEEYEGFYRLHIKPHIGTVVLRSLTVADVQGVISRMVEKGYSDSTLRACRVVLSSALQYARKWKWVDENVARDAEVPRPQRKPAVDYSIDHGREVLAAIEHISARRLLEFCLATAVRPSEGAGICKSDLIYKDGKLVAVRITAQLQHTKGIPGARTYKLVPLKTQRSYRPVPVNDIARSAIEASLQREYKFKTGKLSAQQVTDAAKWAQETGLVFRTAVGTPHTPEGVRKQFYRALEKRSMDRVTRHQLRHLAASLMIDEGESPATVAAILGDSVKTVMDVYVHPFEESKVSALSKLSDRLRNSPHDATDNTIPEEEILEKIRRLVNSSTRRRIPLYQENDSLDGIDV